MEPDPALLRIGELSRRVGVSAHVLRAWERRYGVPRPVRTAGGYRLYSEADEQRIRLMQSHISRGLSAAEAARAAFNEGLSPSTLAQALEGFDEPAAEAALDRLLSDFAIEAVLRDTLLPYLRELGERWRRGEVTVAQEHFASNILRARLAALSQGWGRGRGPQALLACAPDEFHDIPLLAFGIALRRNGWRISYLGACTPIEDVIETAVATLPRLVVLSAVDPVRFQGLERSLVHLAGIAPLALGGRGATLDVAPAAGARLLVQDPVTEALALTST
jgi:MerR family transcriptional regulator, light-induced transcriptional regulator